jgi:hypothetical protein
MTCSRFLVPGCLVLALAWPALSQESDRHIGAPSVTVAPAPPHNATVLFAVGYYGDHIVYIGDGGHEAVRCHGAHNIGFKFTVVSLACVHLWTWGGTYCVYEQVFENKRLSERYKAISPAEAARLLGKNESELTTPFWYRFPPGLLLLLAFCIVVPIGGLVRWAKTRRRPVDSKKEEV